MQIFLHDEKRVCEWFKEELKQLFGIDSHSFSHATSAADSAPPPAQPNDCSRTTNVISTVCVDPSYTAKLNGACQAKQPMDSLIAHSSTNCIIAAHSSTHLRRHWCGTSLLTF